MPLFSAEALASRINNSQSCLLVSCDGTFRGAKAIPQKSNADKAIKSCPTVKVHLVVERVGDKVPDHRPGGLCYQRVGTQDGDSRGGIGPGVSSLCG